MHFLAIVLVVIAVFAVVGACVRAGDVRSNEVREPGGRGVLREACASGATIDDCQKAPNPLLPEWNEVIWGTLSFVVLFVVMWKWGVPR